jgi:septum formation topological specificity factor MinE
MQQGYIIVSAEDASVERAKEKAMTVVRQEIMNSIAQHVSSSTEMTSREIEENNQYTEMLQYVTSVATESADYPFLNGISPSNVAEVYIEKLKKNKQWIYRYHVKYPYTKDDLKGRIEQFWAYENDLQAKMNSFVADDFTTAHSVEEMQQRKADLQVFQSSLPNTDARRSQCDKLLLRYDDMMRNVRIAVDAVSQTEMLVSLRYGERVVTINKAPNLRSECLMNVAAQLLDKQWVISYDYSGCYADEANMAELSYTIQGRKITQTVYIK